MITRDMEAGTELWIWRGLAVRLPVDWEMLQYSLNIESGRCGFADRYGFRFELTWRRVEGAPDFDRMLSDYLAKLTEEGMQDGHRIHNAGHEGLKGVMDGETITRFGCFATEASCLVELVFPWPNARDKVLEAGVLKSFSETTADNTGCHRWRAFGLDVKVPSSLSLGACKVEPAHVEWQFMDRRGRVALRFSRRGMVDEWLHQSVRGWLEREVKLSDRPPARWQHERVGRHAVDRVEGRSAARGWLRRSPSLRSEAWICPEDGRLYNWIAEARPGLPERPLVCCGGE
ncbi:MAG: hypothetical protein HQ523_11140 [Lentisphaerae bacterium]|nr:hypothetical protein [Lentisphaerota bacterium]